MRNRVPVPASERPPIPEFTPVPRKYRHDGWTPERQKAFIEALADCGSVTRAAAQVNMAQANCYTLRRAPGAEAFRRAWDAALDFGVKRLKDIAFERAVEGELVPVFVGGKLRGFRRKHNDALLMFCLRHYGEDARGKRVTVNYFSTKAVAGAASGASTSSGPSTSPGPSTSSGRAGLGSGQAGLGAGQGGLGAGQAGLGAGQAGLGAGQAGLGAGQAGLGAGQAGSGTGQAGLGAGQAGLGSGQAGLGSGQAGLVVDPDSDSHPAHPELVEGSHAEASTTTVRTVISGPATGSGRADRSLDAAAGVMDAFDGVVLDAEAHAAIAAALEACAARARAVEAESTLAWAEDDPEVPFVRVKDGDMVYAGALQPGFGDEMPEPFLPHEMPWHHAGGEVPEYWRETAERLDMLAPAEPAAAPRAGRAKRRLRRRG